MQIDMHYYGTYAMARAAGLKKDIALTIATAAQFIDDNAKNQDIRLKDGSCIHTIATAHHAMDISNISKKDQRKVWVPFHFLPGNIGDNYIERIICRKNSSIMDDVLEYTFSKVESEYFIELVGVIAHIYADTFAHYGFSGITSNKNKVEQKSIRFEVLTDIVTHIKSKMDKFKIKFSGTVSLGHGAVYTFPDRPYLKWSFDYKYGEKGVKHNNLDTYLEGAESLFDYFKKVGILCPFHIDPSINMTFLDIKENVKSLLSLEKSKTERCFAWQLAAKTGNLFKSISEEIPTYISWKAEIESLKLLDSLTVRNKNVYRFFQAASIYRTYLLRDLLPKHNLIVG